jgi:hypothetical protein
LAPHSVRIGDEAHEPIRLPALTDASKIGADAIAPADRVAAGAGFGK